MSQYGHNHLQDDWDTDVRSDAEARQERIHQEAREYFDRATAPQLAAHRAAMKALQALPAHKQDVARADALRIWTDTTKSARDLHGMTLAELTVDGEVSEETSAAWEALYAAPAAQSAEAA